MRRPWLVTITALLEALLGLALIATAVILANEAIHGDASDLSAAGILGVIGLPAAVASWGLWKRKSWGWWLALLADSFGLITFLWDPIRRRVKPDTDEMVFIVVLAVLVLLLLLSPVRRFFLGREKARIEAGAGSQ